MTDNSGKLPLNTQQMFHGVLSETILCEAVIKYSANWSFSEAVILYIMRLLFAVVSEASIKYSVKL